MMLSSVAAAWNLEVELAAEALAQRQAPRAVEPAAERRVDDELHAADLVEEALEDQRLLRRQAAERRLAGGEILDELARGWLDDADLADQEVERAGAEGSSSRQAAIALRSRATPCESSSLRPGASPSQKGIVGAMPSHRRPARCRARRG